MAESPEPVKNLLLGAVCLDIYTSTGQVRPGCGILHNAFHLQQLGCQPLLITRIGQPQSARFLDFFKANGIAILPEWVTEPGEPASIQIAVQPSGEAVITNFVRGVWDDFRLNPVEEGLLRQASHVHTVLVDGMQPEFTRLASQGALKNACVSADFLSFQDFTPADFARLLPALHLAFIGWKGELADPTLAAIEQVARCHPALVVITLGERGIQVFDGRQPGHFQARFFTVEPVPVQRNTNGCGDAFIAYFLAEYWTSRNLERAIARGKIGGSLATQWEFALPDWAY